MQTGFPLLRWDRIRFFLSEFENLVAVLFPVSRVAVLKRRLAARIWTFRVIEFPRAGVKCPFFPVCATITSLDLPQKIELEDPC